MICLGGIFLGQKQVRCAPAIGRLYGHGHERSTKERCELVKRDVALRFVLIFRPNVRRFLDFEIVEFRPGT